MSETTRTRAEIQAEIEAVVRKAFAAGRACSVFEANPCPITREYNIEANYDLDNALSKLETGIAADLIPREEHERALAVAKTTVDTALETLIDPIAFHGGTISYYRVSPRTGQQYRVTVERVDHIPDATKMVEPADAEPVGALIRELNRHSDQIAQTKGGEWTNSHRAITDILEKINRHPAPPQATAVALQGVVEELDRVYAAMQAAGSYGWANSIRHISAALLAKEGE